MCTCLEDSSVLPTSSLLPAKAIDSLPSLIVASRNGLRAISLWAGQPQRCSALIHEELMTGPSATTLSFPTYFTMFSISLSVSLYAIHTRTSPPTSIHQHVLQPFALPRRVIAFTTSRRAVHVCRNRDQSVCVPRSTVFPTSDFTS